MLALLLQLLLRPSLTSPGDTPPLCEDMGGVQDGFGMACVHAIEQPIAEALLQKAGCSEGSGCQPGLDEVQKLVILGSGPAGLSAAIYAARANLDPVVVSVDGGQLEGTDEVENYPGAQQNDCDGSQAQKLHGVSGSAIVETFNEQAKAFGTRFIEGWVESVSLPTPPFVLTLTSGKKLRANALIIASGASTRWLGLPSETKYRSSGVSSCATCDGFFFKNQRVAVIGGGDSAMEESLFLSRICSSVTVIHRRDSFAATALLVDQVMAHPKISIIWNATVDEFYSADQSLLSHVIGEGRPQPAHATIGPCAHSKRPALQRPRARRPSQRIDAPSTVPIINPCVRCCALLCCAVLRACALQSRISTAVRSPISRWRAPS
jgi:thioredoxin reductase